MLWGRVNIKTKRCRFFGTKCTRSPNLATRVAFSCHKITNRPHYRCRPCYADLPCLGIEHINKLPVCWWRCRVDVADMFCKWTVPSHLVLKYIRCFYRLIGKRTQRLLLYQGINSVLYIFLLSMYPHLSCAEGANSDNDNSMTNDD